MKVAAIDNATRLKIETLVKKVHATPNPDLKTTAEILVEIENIGLENVFAYFSV